VTAPLFAALLVAAYLIGAVPFGLIVGRLFYGVDVREHGSGNVGTTNVFRVLGKKAGIAVFILDVLKGFLPALAGVLLFGSWGAVVIAAAPVVGHMYSLFLRGRGGKGVATGAGAVLALEPTVFLILFVGWLVLVFGVRIVSLASLAAATSLPILVMLRDNPRAYGIAALLAAMIVVYAHRGNIRRLVRGEEHRFDPPWRSRRAGDGRGASEVS
jgi:acyl phosphate:glycerol-3-phosphate acyltransferase